jgi:hypothetical protein
MCFFRLARYSLFRAMLAAQRTTLALFRIDPVLDERLTHASRTLLVFNMGFILIAEVA